VEQEKETREAPAEADAEAPAEEAEKAAETKEAEKAENKKGRPQSPNFILVFICLFVFICFCFIKQHQSADQTHDKEHP